MNTLYYGDNLEVLRAHIPDESVDLIYLDPPFNSNRDYNILFKEQSGNESPAQIKAFGDTWNWAGAAESWANFAEICPVKRVIELMNGFHDSLGENDVMAYLVMMSPRLYHLHQVLKPTGSFFLHVDPTAGHYLKVLLDCIFSPKNFRNEIIWHYRKWSVAQSQFVRNHDTIFFIVSQQAKIVLSISSIWIEQNRQRSDSETKKLHPATMNLAIAFLLLPQKKIPLALRWTMFGTFLVFLR